MAKQSKRKIQASIAFPSYIKPMLATLTKEPFNNPDWIFEVKWDGYRVIAYLNKGVVKLLSRAGQNYTKSYPLIVDDLKKTQT